MDEVKLKNPTTSGPDRLFDELLAQIHDIGSSEKVVWKKVLEILRDQR